jgi:hypothetical protein
VEKTNCLNIQTKNRRVKENRFMDVGEYFATLKYVLMAITFVAIVLVFLYAFYGEEEKKG